MSSLIQANRSLLAHAAASNEDGVYHLKADRCESAIDSFEMALDLAKQVYHQAFCSATSDIKLCVTSKVTNPGGFLQHVQLSYTEVYSLHESGMEKVDQETRMMIMVDDDAEMTMCDGPQANDEGFVAYACSAIFEVKSCSSEEEGEDIVIGLEDAAFCVGAILFNLAMVYHHRANPLCYACTSGAARMDKQRELQMCLKSAFASYFECYKILQTIPVPQVLPPSTLDHVVMMRLGALNNQGIVLARQVKICSSRKKSLAKRYQLAHQVFQELGSQSLQALHIGSGNQGQVRANFSDFEYSLIQEFLRNALKWQLPPSSTANCA